MGKALDEIKNGMTMYVAAKFYKIPAMTLSNRIKDKNSGEKCGRPQFLTQEIENDLKEYNLLFESINMPLTKTDARVMAYKLSEENNLNKFTDGMAGRKWLSNFLRRYPEISIRSPEATVYFILLKSNI